MAETSPLTRDWCKNSNMLDLDICNKKMKMESRRVVPDSVDTSNIHRNQGA